MNIIQKTKAFVESYFASNKFDPSHDIHHVERVVKLALRIAEEENSKSNNQGQLMDLEIVHLAALLHDVGDAKYSTDENEVETFLRDLKYPKTDQVVSIVKNVSFKTESTNSGHPCNYLELVLINLKAVQDADRLDAIGAIGIARCFSFGGARNRAFYDPIHKPMFYDNLNMNNTDYGTSSQSPCSLNHFEEKLFRIKDMMKTESGKQLAFKRHEFMLSFVTTFLKEWDTK